jgi:hypothetical protein
VIYITGDGRWMGLRTNVSCIGGVKKEPTWKENERRK